MSVFSDIAGAGKRFLGGSVGFGIGGLTGGALGSGRRDLIKPALAVDTAVASSVPGVGAVVKVGGTALAAYGADAQKKTRRLLQASRLRLADRPTGGANSCR